MKEARGSLVEEKIHAFDTDLFILKMQVGDNFGFINSASSDVSKIGSSVVGFFQHMRYLILQ